MFPPDVRHFSFWIFRTFFSCCLCLAPFWRRGGNHWLLCSFQTHVFVLSQFSFCFLLLLFFCASVTIIVSLGLLWNLTGPMFVFFLYTVSWATMLVPLTFFLTFFVLGKVGVVPSVLFSLFLVSFSFWPFGTLFLWCQCSAPFLRRCGDHWLLYSFRSQVFVLSQFYFCFLLLLFCAAVAIIVDVVLLWNLTGLLGIILSSCSFPNIMPLFPLSLGGGSGFVFIFCTHGCIHGCGRTNGRTRGVHKFVHGVHNCVHGQQKQTITVFKLLVMIFSLVTVIKSATMSGVIDYCLRQYPVNSNNMVKYVSTWLHKAKAKASNNGSASPLLNWNANDYDIIDD